MVEGAPGVGEHRGTGVKGKGQPEDVTAENFVHDATEQRHILCLLN